jgi:hypothetical protein
MKKIHIILLYTKSIIQPENTNVYSFLKENSSLKRDSNITFSEIDNERGEMLEILFKEEAFKYDSLDYLIGIDLDYLFIPSSKIEEAIFSFIKDDVDELDFPFLCGIKKHSLLKNNRCILREMNLDAFDSLNARDISFENILKLKQFLFDRKILFVDFYIQSKKMPIFIALDKPFISSSSSIDYLSIGDDNPIFSFLEFQKKESILDEILKLDEYHSLFYIRFSYIGLNKTDKNIIEIKIHDFPSSYLDDRNGILCIFGSKNDIHHYLRKNEIVKLFLEKK